MDCLLPLLPAERELLLDLPDLPVDLRRRLACGILQEGAVACRLDGSDLLQLGLTIESLAGQQSGAVLPPVLDEVRRRIVCVCRGEEPDPGEVLPECGLTRRQLQILLTGSWKDDQAGLKLRPDLPLDRLEGSAILHNARLLLRMAVEGDGIGITVEGHLNRAAVRRCVHTMRWEQSYRRRLLEADGALNEAAVFPLLILRLVLGRARLLRRRKRRLLATRLGERLLAEDQAGSLQALLFETFFQRLNLSCLDRWPDLPLLQHSVAHSLWQLRRLAQDWTPPVPLTSRLLVPGLAAAMPAAPQAELLDYLVRGRILRPLEIFGLLDCRYAETEDPWRLDLVCLRVSGIFDDFFDFRF